MKLICKCGNVENLKKDISIEDFQLKSCGDGTLALICKKCSEVVYINMKSD